MKCVIRNGVFETNSSSDSALFFTDHYPTEIENEFYEIYEITNDGYKKMCYAFAFLLGKNLNSVTQSKKIALKESFIAYYLKKYKVERNAQFDAKLEEDVNEILEDYYSTIGVGDTCLQPLLDDFGFKRNTPDEKLPPLPSEEELKKILIKYFHKRSYVSYVHDEL